MTAPHERLRAHLGDPALYLDDPADTARYARDWIGKCVGSTPLVVRPRSTEEVAAVLAACAELDVPVVPQAGNTGMVGGGVPRAGEVVLSVERLNAIEAFDEASASVRVQAGVVLETLQTFLAERGCDMPVDLGARGSCQIGGMIATNAGGIKVLRYGHMREQVRGLEVVLADGTVVSGLNILKKNNTGIDLKQVFIGSEGTLGVITRAVLQVQPKPEAFQTALAGIAHRDLLPALLQAARARFPRLSSLEFIDGRTIAYVRQVEPDLRIPPRGRPCVARRDRGGIGGRRARRRGLRRRARKPACGRIDHRRRGRRLRGTGAGDLARARGADRGGEPARAHPQIRRDGAARGDSPPSSARWRRWPRGLTACARSSSATSATAMLTSIWHRSRGSRTPTFGPWRPILAGAIYGAVHRHAGSISAEHGIGVMKRAYLPLARTPEEIALMRTLKAALDPKGILNPGVILAP